MRAPLSKFVAAHRRSLSFEKIICCGTAGYLGAVILSVDAVGALHQWARLAVNSLDAKRAGDANAWSGWCADYRADRLSLCGSSHHVLIKIKKR